MLHSPETIARIRQANLGRSHIVKEATREKLRQYYFSLPTDIKEAQRRSRTMFRHTTETKKRLSEIHKLHPNSRLWSSESREKIRKATLGRVMQAATREKISRANSGRKRTIETRLKLSAIRMGHSVSAETREKIKQKTTLQMSSPENRLKISIVQRGELGNNWKGGRSTLSNSIWHCTEMIQWRNSVFTRDNYTCKHCGIRGRFIDPHHITTFAEILTKNKILTLDDARNCSELWDVDNGKTLCKDCHKLEHRRRIKHG